MDPHQEDNPFVSVIVPTRNERRLPLVLEALRGQTYDAYEVIVCDNGSTTDVMAQVEAVSKAVPTQVVFEDRPGSYAARNAGLAEARGSVLAFTDADCLPAADWIANGVAAVSGGRATDLVAGRIEIFPSGWRMTAAEVFETVNAFPQRRYVERDRYGATANLFVRRSVVDQIGGFNSSLRSGGDREFCNRAVNAGFTLRYDDAMLVRHPARRRLGELRSKQRRTSRGAFDNGVITPTLSHVMLMFRPPMRRILNARSAPALHSRGEWWRYAMAMTFLHYGFTLDHLRWLVEDRLGVRSLRPVDSQ